MKKFFDNSGARIKHLTLAVAAMVAVLGVAATPGWAAGTNNYQRSITMSSAKPSDTPVTYTVQFTVDSSYSLSALVIDFCSNSPAVGQTCTAPGGFTVGATPTATNVTVNGTPAGGTWTASSQSGGRTFIYSGSAGTAVVVGDVVSFDITSVTNPNTVTSFYGRILSYSIASPTYSDVDTDTFQESGGVALATANGIGFVFQVPESLQFCVYKVTCGDAPYIVLGHGLNQVLDDSQIDRDTVKFSIATNALNGATVYGTGLPPHQPGGTPYLNPVKPNGSPVAMVAGTEGFGLKILPTSGPISANWTYRDFGGDTYTFDEGQEDSLKAWTRQATAGPFDTVEFTVTFAATASKVTQAGEYTTIMPLVAVGKF